MIEMFDQIRPLVRVELLAPLRHLNRFTNNAMNTSKIFDAKTCTDQEIQHSSTRMPDDALAG